MGGPLLALFARAGCCLLMPVIESSVQPNQIGPRYPLQPHPCRDRRWLSCGAGLLLPSLFVHPDHEEPHDQRSSPEKAEGCNVGEQTVSERQIQETQPA